MDRFDKFTDRARKVLTLAQDEAQRFNHNYIGTEHLLLGLVREGEGVAARVLENMNVELAKVRTAVEFIIGRGDRPVVGEVGLTPRAKRVIELAIDEARRLGHNYIGTEHLLLGLVREGEGIAAGVLESLGVNLDKVRHEVIRVLSQSSSAGPTPEAKRASKTPTVDQLGINLTDAARAGKLDPVIGREKEMDSLVNGLVAGVLLQSEFFSSANWSHAGCGLLADHAAGAVRLHPHRRRLVLQRLRRPAGRLVRLRDRRAAVHPGVRPHVPAVRHR